MLTKRSAIACVCGSALSSNLNWVCADLHQEEIIYCFVIHLRNTSRDEETMSGRALNFFFTVA